MAELYEQGEDSASEYILPAFVLRLLGHGENDPTLMAEWRDEPSASTIVEVAGRLFSEYRARTQPEILPMP